MEIKIESNIMKKVLKSFSLMRRNIIHLSQLRNSHKFPFDIWLESLVSGKCWVWILIFDWLSKDLEISWNRKYKNKKNDSLEDGTLHMVISTYLCIEYSRCNLATNEYWVITVFISHSLEVFSMKNKQYAIIGIRSSELE